MTAVPGGVPVAGWVLVHGDYAQPATAGGGYVEVQDDGVFEIAYEADDSLVSMGVNHCLLTRVPAEVLRRLLRNYDAKREAGGL